MTVLVRTLTGSYVFRLVLRWSRHQQVIPKSPSENIQPSETFRYTENYCQPTPISCSCGYRIDSCCCCFTYSSSFHWVAYLCTIIQSSSLLLAPKLTCCLDSKNLRPNNGSLVLEFLDKDSNVCKGTWLFLLNLCILSLPHLLQSCSAKLIL